jgi:hypothetical protein
VEQHRDAEVDDDALESPVRRRRRHRAGCRDERLDDGGHGRRRHPRLLGHVGGSPGGCLGTSPGGRDGGSPGGRDGSSRAGRGGAGRRPPEHRRDRDPRLVVGEGLGQCERDQRAERGQQRAHEPGAGDADPGVLLGHGLDQREVFEAGERHADGGARDAEPVLQLGVAQPLALGELARHDGVEDELEDLVAVQSPTERGRRGRRDGHRSSS